MRLIRTNGIPTGNPFVEIERFFNTVAAAQAAQPSASFTSTVDVFETPETLEVQVDLPGFKQESIEVQLENGILTLSAERPEAAREGALHHVTERRYGKFERSFKLPTNVDPEQVAARFTDGVLQVTLPKRAESKARKIKLTPA